MKAAVNKSLDAGGPRGWLRVDGEVEEAPRLPSAAGTQREAVRPLATTEIQKGKERRGSAATRDHQEGRVEPALTHRNTQRGESPRKNSLAGSEATEMGTPHLPHRTSEGITRARETDGQLQCSRAGVGSRREHQAQEGRQNASLYLSEAATGERERPSDALIPGA